MNVNRPLILLEHSLKNIPGCMHMFDGGWKDKAPADKKKEWSNLEQRGKQNIHKT